MASLSGLQTGAAPSILEERLRVAIQVEVVRLHSLISVRLVLVLVLVLVLGDVFPDYDLVHFPWHPLSPVHGPLQHVALHVTGRHTEGTHRLLYRLVLGDFREEGKLALLVHTWATDSPTPWMLSI